ncbi:hypothetical protein C0Q70_12921 [Pomacea canaliculata]|uniref:G-protein coupled receptors family 1 profile domain-containing protein n=2 Tax=Pomacea canaliculata TaxID=400727 RepID=A0A2T7P2U7_POMCA|nr:hypothetical protein C0Q70_12921 [Pomacea canaliculata]
MNRQRRGINQPNKDDQGQQSKFSSDYSEPQQAWDSQNTNPNSDAKKGNFSVMTSPETSSVDAQTTQESLNTVLNEPLSLEMPVMLQVSSPAIKTTVGVQLSDNSNLIPKNITSPQPSDELTSENTTTFKVKEKEMKDDGKRTLGRKDGGSKQTRFSKTTLMMLVLTMTTIVLFVPHLVIEIWKGGCLDVHSPVMEMNICQVAHIFPYLNSVINPFIYSFCNPKFRLQCRLFLRSVYNCVSLPI